MRVARVDARVAVLLRDSAAIRGEADVPAAREELGSGSGIVRRASEAGLAAVDARAVQAAARAGDHKAKEILEDAITACAAGVASLVFSLCPDTVVMRRRQALVGAAPPGVVDGSTLPRAAARQREVLVL